MNVLCMYIVVTIQMHDLLIDAWVKSSRTFEEAFDESVTPNTSHIGMNSQSQGNDDDQQ